MRFAEIQAGRLASYAGMVQAMYAGTLHGVVVRGLYPPAVMAHAAAALARRQGISPAVAIERRRPAARIHGIMIAPTRLAPRGPRLDAYLRAAPAADELLARIFPEDRPYEARLAAALTALAGLPARRMNGYAPATIRVFPPGTDAAVHCDSYQANPVYKGLREVGDLTTQLSAYVPLTVPERGGELHVYALGRDDRPDPDAPSLALAPLAGDLLLFDAGRLQHRVARVGGRRARRTIGSFVALARDHAGVIYWG